MKSKQFLTELFNEANRLWCEEPKYTTHDLWEMCKHIQDDLDVLEILKGYFNYTEYGQWYIDMQESDFDFKSECSKEEWDSSPQKKIKEWLNGK